jgi:ABC-type branched-subunit amino acid transport system ATPase component
VRIRKIEIGKWRNFQNITIELPDHASLVCLVGANGTGKTHILELISACAHHIGLSSGIEIPRGNPLTDPVRDFAIELYLAQGVSDALDTSFGQPEVYGAWDRILRFEGQSGHVFAGGIENSQSSQSFAQEIVRRLRQSKEVHHLTLDADRAFPKRDMSAHEMAQTFEQHWHDSNWNKGRAFQTTRTLYDEWIKYCLARENKAANLFYQEARRAAEKGETGPEFSDAFASYRKSLREVMPHLLFAGADQERKAILFDTSGMELRFDQLSGGERKIALLTGQIDRFGLRNGIFLLDEPELHLNPDLVRSWVTYLANTVATGQVWLATHSLEAVEAAGLNSTILLQRDPATKLVDQVSSLSNQPVLSALSRAVGTPAFSITALRFVFIEGEEAIGERERYRKVTGLGADTRFIECGSCSEVVRRLSTIQQIAREAQQAIRIAGVIDRDWRTKNQIDELTKKRGLIALPVHEIENLFLHRETLIRIATQNGRNDFDYDRALQEACDSRAGGWIIQSALSDESCSDISKLPTDARAFAYSLAWREIESDPSESIREIIKRSRFDGERKEKLLRRLETFAKIYARKRIADSLWKNCEGKEVLKIIAWKLGFLDHQALENAVSAFWTKNPEGVPEEVKMLRASLLAE